MAYKIYFYDNEYDCVGVGCLASSYIQYRLQEAQGMDIEVHISSMGGSAFDAVAIYNMLKGYSGKVTTIIDSVAASAAATIFMAGSERIISKYGLLMIHKASTISAGTSDDLNSDVKMLEAIEESIISIYVDATGLDVEAVTALVNETTWMNAESALQMGFATSINDYAESENEVVYNSATITKSLTGVPNKYHNVINKVLTTQPDEMKTEDKELIEKNNGLFNKVMNFFKKATIETTTNKGKLKSFAPLNVGVAVMNEDDTETEDGDYEVDNEGKKVKMKVKGGKVENMEDEEATNSADTEEEKATNLVLNSVNIKVTNKAEAAGIAKVVSNHVTTINSQNALIAELTGQLKVSNAAVERDEAKIKEDIKTEFTPSGSKRSTIGAVDTDKDKFKPAGTVAQNAVKRALGGAPGIVK